MFLKEYAFEDLLSRLIHLNQLLEVENKCTLPVDTRSSSRQMIVYTCSTKKYITRQHFDSTHTIDLPTIYALICVICFYLYIWMNKRKFATLEDPGIEVGQYLHAAKSTSSSTLRRAFPLPW